MKGAGVSHVAEGSNTSFVDAVPFCGDLASICCCLPYIGVGSNVEGVGQHFRAGGDPVVNSRSAENPQVSGHCAGGHAQPTQPRPPVRAVRPRPGTILFVILSVVGVVAVVVGGNDLAVVVCAVGSGLTVGVCGFVVSAPKMILHISLQPPIRFTCNRT